MDGSVTRLEEHRLAHRDSPHPSPKQYLGEIGAVEFEATDEESLGHVVVRIMGAASSIALAPNRKH